MSERRKVQSALTDAAFRLEDAARHLDEAVQLLESYEFLQEANPPLRAQILVGARALRQRAQFWLEYKVEA